MFKRLLTVNLQAVQYYVMLIHGSLCPILCRACNASCTCCLYNMKPLYLLTNNNTTDNLTAALLLAEWHVVRLFSANSSWQLTNWQHKDVLDVANMILSLPPRVNATKTRA